MIIRKLLRFSILFLLYHPLSHAHTQSLRDTSTVNPLDEVLIQENRLQIPFNELNRNVNVLTKEQIKRLPARSVNELLSYIPGVDVRQRGPWGAQADISIDGGTFEQTTILVNGTKVNDPQTAHHSMNIPIPLGAIERIEVIRGPAARIYGINSLTGAINIVTKTPDSTYLEADVHASSSFKSKEEGQGIYQGRGVQLGGGIASKNSSHLIYGSYDGGNGYRYNTPFQNEKLFYQGKIKSTENAFWDFLGGYTYNNFGANAYYAPPNDKEAKEIVQTALFSAGFTGRTWNDRLSIHPRISYRYNFDDYRYDQYHLDLFRNLHHSHVFDTEINSTYRISSGTIGFGLEMRNELLRSTNMGNRNRNNYGVYGEYRTHITDLLTADIGAYLNYNSSYGWQVYPGLDVGYAFAPAWRIYINSGTGQRVPSFTDLYTTGGGNIGNPDLQPEKAWYAEGGLKYSIPLLQVNMSYFYRKTTDFIDWTRISTDQNWAPDNFMRNEVFGLNLSSDIRLQEDAHTWLFSLAYNYLRPQVTQQDHQTILSKYAIESLRHQLAGRISFIGKAFSLNLSERFLERINYKSYFLTDLRMNKSWKRFNIYLDANNIFDITYIETSAIPLPGRWFNIGFNTRF